MELEEWLEIDAYERMETGEGPIAVDRYVPPKERLAIRLWGTEWSVGQLTLHLRKEEDESGPGIQKFTAHPLDLATHPRRGVVNARVLALGEGLTRSEVRDYVQSSAERLRMTTGVLRDAVRQELRGEPVGTIWEDLALPIEPLYILRDACAAIDPESVNIDPSRVIHAPWDDLPSRLEDKMPERAVAERSKDPNPVEAVNQTVRSLTRDFIDHESYIDKWQFVTDQLFDDDERAA